MGQKGLKWRTWRDWCILKQLTIREYQFRPSPLECGMGELLVPAETGSLGIGHSQESWRQPGIFTGDWCLRFLHVFVFICFHVAFLKIFFFWLHACALIALTTCVQYASAFFCSFSGSIMEHPAARKSRGEEKGRWPDKCGATDLGWVMGVVLGSADV